MLHLFKHRAAALAAAALVLLLSVAPAAAQGSYPGGYMAGPARNTYGRSAQGAGGYGSMYGGGYGGGGYGSMYGGGYGGYSGSAYGRMYGKKVYRIVRGDTLTRIARRFGVSIRALLRANPSIRNPDLIFAGRFLVLPSYSRSAPSYAPRYPPSGGYQAPGAPSGGYQAPSAPSGGYSAPAPAPAQPPAATPMPGPTPAPGRQTANIDLTAHNMAFSLSTITVPAGSHVVVHFTNQDPMPHNLAVYTNSSAQQMIFRGPTVMGPNATATYEFDAPTQPGTYFFRCDVHPTVMNGQFIVQ